MFTIVYLHLYFSLIILLSELQGVRSDDKCKRMGDWILQVLSWKWQVRDEKGTFVNWPGQMSSERPSANVTKWTKCERHRNVRQRTLQSGPNANVSARPQNVRQ